MRGGTTASSRAIPRGREDIVTGSNGKLTRRELIIYRTATGLVVAVMVFSIVNFIFNDHFPFPNGPEGAFVHPILVLASR